MKSPYLLFLGPIAAVVLGILFKFRLLPFLKGETILKGGKLVPTENFSNFGARLFFGFAGFAFVLAIVKLRHQKRGGKK